MTKVWFHADDVGATSNMTDEVLELWQQGCLDGFSIFGNGLATSNIQKALSDNSQRPMRVGVHLNITDGPPSHKDSQNSVLCQNGFLNLSFEGFIKRWCLSSSKERKILLNHVASEWRAQIKRVKEIVAPREIHILDGHNHIHMIRPLFEIAVELAKSEGIPCLRSSRDPWVGARSARPINLVKGTTLEVLFYLNRKLLKESGLSFPAYTAGILFSGEMKADYCVQVVKWAKLRKVSDIEFVFHPGTMAQEDVRKWCPNSKANAFFLHSNRNREKQELVKWKQQFSELSRSL